MRLKTSKEPYRRTRNLHGRLVVRQSQWGLIAQKWPRKRGRSKTPGDVWWRGTWGTAAQMSGKPYHLDQSFAEAWTPGTKFLPRDLLTAAALGMLFELDDTTGLIQGTVMTVAANPQATLDLIGNTPGSILFRRTNGWHIVPAGLGGQVLMFDSLDRLIWSSIEKSTGIPTQSNARLILNNDQTAQDISALTAIQFEAAQYDTDNRWSSPGSPGRITFAATDAGKVAMLTGQVELTGVANGARVILQIRHYDSANQLKSNSGLNITHPSGTVLLPTQLQTNILADGDYARLEVFAAGATNATIKQTATHFALAMLS